MDATSIRTAIRQGVFVAAVAVVTLFTDLGGPRLWDRDEPRNAGCAREMLQRGDWVTPVFNGELRAHKPVLLYWLIMSAYSVLGVNEFAARFWSAALGVGAVVCTYLLGRRLFRPQVGVWAGVILSTSLMFDVAGRAATPDAALIFFSTLALTIFVLGTTPANRARLHDRPGFATVDRLEAAWSPGRWWTWALAYAAMGCAVLAKGPVGFILPAMIIGLFVLVVYRPLAGPARAGAWSRVLRIVHPRQVARTLWTMRPFTAAAIVCLVALPWYILVGLRTDGQFLREFFWSHHFGRATAAMEGHDGGIWFYPIAVLVGTFPWSVFAVPVLLDVVARLRGRRVWTAGHVLSVCWMGVFVGVFSLARTKLPSYVTPCYPAIALVVACFVDGWTRQTQLSSAFWTRLALAVFAFVGLGMLIAAPLAAPRVLPGESWLAAIGLVPLLGGLNSLVLAWRGQHRRAAHVFACASVVLVVCLFSVAAKRVDQHQHSVVIMDRARREVGDVRFAAFGCLEPSWVFYAGQPIEQLTLGGPATSERRWVDQGGRWASQPWSTAPELLRRRPNAAIITSDEYAAALRAQLPGDFRVVASGPYFLKKHQLLIFARLPDHARVPPRLSARQRQTR